MEDIHRPYWKHFINLIPEQDLSECTVLDFGCSRGGFLRHLHEAKPFAKGIGIDIASASINEANKLAGDRPLTYHIASDPSQLDAQFDLAFSYEVIYVLQDLSEHARQIKQSLRRNGVYYAVTGCHTESALWNKRREVLASRSSAVLPDYSPDDFVDAFASNGFDVTFRRFGFNEFIPVPTNRKFHPGIMDALSYNAEEKLIFRFSR